jgi:hypothetical protein
MDAPQQCDTSNAEKLAKPVFCGMSGRAIVLRHLPQHAKVRSHTGQSGDTDAGEHKREAVLDRAVTIGFRACRFPAWPHQTSPRGSTAAPTPCPHRVPAQSESIRSWCARRRSGCHPCRSRAQSGVGARWKLSREGSRGKRPSAVGKYGDEGSERFGLVDRCAQLGGSPLQLLSGSHACLGGGAAVAKAVGIVAGFHRCGNGA